MTTGITLRPATNLDYDWLRRLHHATMRESVEHIWGWDEAEQDEYFRAHFDPSRLQIIVLEGQDVGAVEVERRPDAIVLANIQIVPESQNRGIGSALIRDLQRQAQSVGVPVTLQVNRVNRAREAYERLGFVQTGETETHYLMRWTPSHSARSGDESS